MSSNYMFFTFHTTADAMMAEHLLKADHIEGRLVTIPRQLTANCGLAWRSDASLEAEILDILAKHHIDINQHVVL